jgi:hypothetical protein
MLFFRDRSPPVRSDKSIVAIELSNVLKISRPGTVVFSRSPKTTPNKALMSPHQGKTIGSSKP